MFLSEYNRFIRSRLKNKILAQSQGGLEFQPADAHRKCPWGEYCSILRT